MPLPETYQVQIDEAYKDLCEQLELTWYEKIPISRALGVKIAGFDGERLCVRADFEANINLHGTAFAGSLYAVTALCGWSMVHLQLALAKLAASIVLVEGNIRYAAPVCDAILAVCDFGSHQQTIEALKRGKRKGRFALASQIDQDGRPAATFEGSFAALLD